MDRNPLGEGKQTEIRLVFDFFSNFLFFAKKKEEPFRWFWKFRDLRENVAERPITWNVIETWLPWNSLTLRDVWPSSSRLLKFLIRLLIELSFGCLCTDVLAFHHLEEKLILLAHLGPVRHFYVMLRTKFWKKLKTRSRNNLEHWSLFFTV